MLNQQAKSKQSRSILAEQKALDCVVRLMGEGGFESAQMAAISKASGVSIGSLYHHFGSKEGILGHLILREEKKTRERLDALDLTGKSFDEGLYALVELTVGHVTRNVGLYRSMMLRATASPEIWEPFLKLRADIDEYMQQTLGPAITERGFADVGMRVRLMHQTVVATLMHAANFKSGPVKLDNADLTEQVFYLARNIVLGQPTGKGNEE